MIIDNYLKHEKYIYILSCVETYHCHRLSEHTVHTHTHLNISTQYNNRRWVVNLKHIPYCIALALQFLTYCCNLIIMFLIIPLICNESFVV